MFAAAASAIPLKIFFSCLLAIVLAAGVYILRNRQRFFAHGKEGDTNASANLRMWMIILVWLHAVVILTLTIFEV